MLVLPHELPGRERVCMDSLDHDGATGDAGAPVGSLSPPFFPLTGFCRRGLRVRSNPEGPISFAVSYGTACLWNPGRPPHILMESFSPGRPGETPASLQSHLKGSSVKTEASRGSFQRLRPQDEQWVTADAMGTRPTLPCTDSCDPHNSGRYPLTAQETGTQRVSDFPKATRLVCTRIPVSWVNAYMSVLEERVPHSDSQLTQSCCLGRPLLTASSVTAGDR